MTAVESKDHWKYEVEQEFGEDAKKTIEIKTVYNFLYFLSYLNYKFSIIFNSGLRHIVAKDKKFLSFFQNCVDLYKEMISFKKKENPIYEFLQNNKNVTIYRAYDENKDNKTEILLIKDVNINGYLKEISGYYQIFLSFFTNTSLDSFLYSRNYIITPYEKFMETQTNKKIIILLLLDKIKTIIGNNIDNLNVKKNFIINQFFYLHSLITFNGPIPDLVDKKDGDKIQDTIKKNDLLDKKELIISKSSDLKQMIEKIQEPDLNLEEFSLNDEYIKDIVKYPAFQKYKKEKENDEKREEQNFMKDFVRGANSKNCIFETEQKKRYNSDNKTPKGGNGNKYVFDERIKVGGNKTVNYEKEVINQIEKYIADFENNKLLKELSITGGSEDALIHFLFDIFESFKGKDEIVEDDFKNQYQPIQKQPIQKPSKSLDQFFNVNEKNNKGIFYLHQAISDYSDLWNKVEKYFDLIKYGDYDKDKKIISDLMEKIKDGDVKEYFTKILETDLFVIDRYLNYNKNNSAINRYNYTIKVANRSRDFLINQKKKSVEDFINSTYEDINNHILAYMNIDDWGLFFYLNKNMNMEELKNAKYYYYLFLGKNKNSVIQKKIYKDLSELFNGIEKDEEKKIGDSKPINLTINLLVNLIDLIKDQELSKYIYTRIYLYKTETLKLDQIYNRTPIRNIELLKKGLEEYEKWFEKLKKYYENIEFYKEKKVLIDSTMKLLEEIIKYRKIIDISEKYNDSSDLVLKNKFIQGIYNDMGYQTKPYGDFIKDVKDNFRSAYSIYNKYTHDFPGGDIKELNKEENVIPDKIDIPKEKNVEKNIPTPAEIAVKYPHISENKIFLFDTEDKRAEYRETFDKIKEIKPKIEEIKKYLDNLNQYYKDIEKIEIDHTDYINWLFDSGSIDAYLQNIYEEIINRIKSFDSLAMKDNFTKFMKVEMEKNKESAANTTQKFSDRIKSLIQKFFDNILKGYNKYQSSKVESLPKKYISEISIKDNELRNIVDSVENSIKNYSVLSKINVKFIKCVKIFMSLDIYIEFFENKKILINDRFKKTKSDIYNSEEKQSEADYPMILNMYIENYSRMNNYFIEISGLQSVYIKKITDINFFSKKVEELQKTDENNKITYTNKFSISLLEHYYSIFKKIFKVTRQGVNRENIIFQYLEKYHYISMQRIYNFLFKFFIESKQEGNFFLHFTNKNCPVILLMELNEIKNFLDYYYSDFNKSLSVHLYINDYQQFSKEVISNDKNTLHIQYNGYANEEIAVYKKLYSNIENLKPGGIPFKKIYNIKDFATAGDISYYMSLASNIKQRQGTAIYSYGYSGVGKTYSILGPNGILKSTLENFDDIEIYMRVYELYGLGCQYNYYWNKEDDCYPDIFEILIHHNIIENDRGIKHKDADKRKVISKRDDMIIYISNLYNPEEHSYLSSGKFPAYVKVTNKHLKKLSTFLDSIEKLRGEGIKIGENTYQQVRSTPNNPTSSRSILVYEFQFKVDNKFIPLIIYDLPGKENIYKTYVDPEKYNTKSDLHFNLQNLKPSKTSYVMNPYLYLIMTVIPKNGNHYEEYGAHMESIINIYYELLDDLDRKLNNDDADKRIAGVLGDISKQRYEYVTANGNTEVSIGNIVNFNGLKVEVKPDDIINSFHVDRHKSVLSDYKSFAINSYIFMILIHNLIKYKLFDIVVKYLAKLYMLNIDDDDVVEKSLLKDCYSYFEAFYINENVGGLLNFLIKLKKTDSPEKINIFQHQKSVKSDESDEYAYLRKFVIQNLLYTFEFSYVATDINWYNDNEYQSIQYKLNKDVFDTKGKDELYKEKIKDICKDYGLDTNEDNNIIDRDNSSTKDIIDKLAVAVELLDRQYYDENKIFRTGEIECKKAGKFLDNNYPTIQDFIDPYRYKIKKNIIFYVVNNKEDTVLEQVGLLNSSVPFIKAVKGSDKKK